MREKPEFPDYTPEEIVNKLQQHGVTGAGGAGFPTYVKWEKLDSIDCLLVNLQEGEPVFYGDRWLVNNSLDFYKEGFEYLLEKYFRLITIGTKEKYRGEWLGKLEETLEPKIYQANDLPIPVTEEDGLVLALTGPRYEISQEPVLLWQIAGQQVGDDLPTEHGWLVQNAETVYNIFQALLNDRPVTQKQLVVYGPRIPQSYFGVPVGTPIFELFDAMDLGTLPAENLVLLDGGPGWCCEIDVHPQKFGVTKRTNGIMVADRDFVEKYRDPNEPQRINSLEAQEWKTDSFPDYLQEFKPDVVSIPMISNPALEGTVNKSVPVVEEGKRVSVGEVIGRPASSGFSNYQHASIMGTVKKVTPDRIVIER